MIERIKKIKINKTKVVVKTKINQMTTTFKFRNCMKKDEGKGFPFKLKQNKK
jgi:hypothetical protein